MRSLSELAAAVAAVLLLTASPRVAVAHEVGHEIMPRGKAWAVRVLYHHGKPLAGATYQLLRPGSDEVVREGKTDAQGWVEFVPDLAGKWRVKIIDPSGHGKVVPVDVLEAVSAAPEPSAPLPAPTAPPTPAAAPTPTPIPTQPSSATADGPGLGGVALGALAIALTFVAVRVLRRNRAG